MDRRQVLRLAGVGLLGGWLSSGCQSRSGQVSGQPLTEPPILTSYAGSLRVQLQAAAGPLRIAGQLGNPLQYNNSLPGPTLVLQPGDRLHLRLVNQLSAPTNLHLHGLHVSPQGHGDNPFVTVRPGESYDYDYRLPVDHQTGTFWYHPHLHGAAANQVSAGLYGAIIVSDRVANRIPVTRERILVVADSPLADRHFGPGRSPMHGPNDRWGYLPGLVLVNGQERPLLTARPGQRERWRVVNASSTRTFTLHVDGQQVRLLAIDAGQLPQPRLMDRAGVEALAPGNRADLLVDTRRGTGQLRADISRSTDMSMMGGAMKGGARSGGRSTTRTNHPLADIKIAGEQAVLPRRVPLQSGVRSVVRDLRGHHLAARRRLSLGMSMKGEGWPMGADGMEFTIDGRTFDPARVDQQVKGGTVEEWVIRNTSVLDHPFHLHVWPMQVIEVNAVTVDEPQWRDVVTVPADGYVRVLISFDDFVGRTVYHCHLLHHEDRGMMGVVEVTAGEVIAGEVTAGEATASDG